MSSPTDFPPVYLFTIDSLRADFFDEERFPSCFERFTTDFACFSNAYANGIATPLAFPSILADDLVTGDGTLSPEATTLAERLPEPSIAVRNNVHLSEERGYHRGFSQFGIDVDLSGYLRRAITLRSVRQDGIKHVRRRLPFLENPVAPILYRSAERIAYESKRSLRHGTPAFLWAHFMDPHGPYHPDLVFDREVSVRFDDPSFEEAQRRWDEDGELPRGTVEMMVRVYEEKIRYLDRQLADLFAWLEGAGRYEDALIVLTADHGQLLGEGGRFGHDWDNLPVDELVRVPLLIKFPDASHASRVISHPVQHLDIHPTIAEWLPSGAGVSPESQPLTESGDRLVLAKSNSAVRGISEEGEVLRHADGSTEVSGDPDDALLNRVEAEAPASVGTDVGQARMTEVERRRVNEQLEGLGYR